MLIKARDFQITAPALLFEPEYYIFDFLPESGQSKFLVVQEKLLDLAPFVDIRFEPLAQAQFLIPSRELLQLEGSHGIQRPRSSYIFHHAFVCSTLLARCVNQIDAFFSLKEPWVLRRLSDFKRTQGQRIPVNQWREMFVCYNSLLAKNYHNGKAPVIKVTNVANNLLADVLKYLPDNKVLYLYSDLENFLISNLKKPHETQVKMPALATAFLSDSDFASRFPQFSDVRRLSFLQVCALIWLVNLYNFKSKAEAVEQRNIRTLEMNQFLSDMRTCLEKLSLFFGHASTPMDLDKMMDQSVTATDAKHQNVAYGTQSKQAERKVIIERHGVEINQALNWIKPVVEGLGVLEFCKARQLIQ